MKSKIIFISIVGFVLGGSLLLKSCKKNDFLFRSTPLPFVVPPGFPQPVFNFQNNPTSEEGFVLGRKLFHDGRLSINGNHPCSSCHQQIAAFTTFEHDRSHGFNNSHTLRNAPGLSNLAWYPVFNQDGSATDLATVYRKHITHPLEMGESENGIINKLKNDPVYLKMFRAAFGSDIITSEKIYNALSQFVLNLVSANSKYDKMVKGEITFTSEEQQGYALFKAKCNTCHTEPLFTDFTYRNTGLQKDPVLNDVGRMKVSNVISDSLKFRVPSLRNVDYTSYYSHDGRFSVIRMMLQHYRFGVQQSPTTNPLIANGITLTNGEENAIIAFLRTLSDTSFVNNPRFQE